MAVMMLPPLPSILELHEFAPNLSEPVAHASVPDSEAGICTVTVVGAATT
jgi:hypothetical protein